MEGVESTAGGAVQTAQRLVTPLKDDTDRVQGLGRRAATTLRVLDAPRHRPVLTLNEVRRRVCVSFPTATKGMDALVELGIAREITGGRRNRVFGHDACLSILSEGAEPL